MKSKLLFAQSVRRHRLRVETALIDFWYWLHVQRRCVWCGCRTRGNPLAKLQLPVTCNACLRKRIAALPPMPQTEPDLGF